MSVSFTVESLSQQDFLVERWLGQENLVAGAKAWASRFHCDLVKDSAVVVLTISGDG